MAHIRKPDDWDEVKERVLDYVFAGRYSITRVAELVDVSPRTLARWIKLPQFIERLEAKRVDLEKALTDVTYADKIRRIIALNEMAESARTKYEEKPLLVERRQIGFDKDEGKPLYMENESFNRDAFESFRGALDDIAKELGHRKVDTTTVNNIQQNVIFYLPEIADDPTQVIYDSTRLEQNGDTSATGATG